MVGPLEQAILALMIAVIMLGMGASLTPRDFTSALKLTSHALASGATCVETISASSVSETS